MSSFKISPRLRAAADMIRSDVRLADVGTDHAYLPIALCLEGKIRGGVVSDVREGPIARARKNIEEGGVGHMLTAILADGLDGIEKYCPDDIAILGMGGELIARIIGDAPWTKNGHIRLCLQPMTHPEILRKFLYSSGFDIIDERLVSDDGRIYQLMLAQFIGTDCVPSASEALLGKINMARGGVLFEQLCRQTANTLGVRRDGLATAGKDTSALDALIKEILSYVH